MTEQLTKMDKLEARWQAKLSPKLPDGSPPFQSSEAEKTYRESILRFKDAIADGKLVTEFPSRPFPVCSLGSALA